MYGLLLAVIYIAFFSLGIPDSLLGSGWPAMHEDLNIPVSYLGIISTTISAGTIVSSLLSNRLTTKFGTAIVTVGSVLLTVIGIFGFSFSNSFFVLIIFSVPYGLGAGSIDATLNNYVALHYKAKHMVWLHCFWGIGTIVSPFIMGYALGVGSWNNGYRIVGFIQLAIVAVLFASLPIWKINKSERTSQSQGSIGLFQAFKIKGVPFLLIGFFSYCALEATTMYWASTYFVEVKNVGVDEAADLAALFYIGITAGRFISGFIAEKIGDRNMIRTGTCIMLCGIVLLFIPTASYVLAVIAFIVIGIGCAPVYPCIIHSTPSNFGAEYSGSVIGIQMASAYVGNTAMPPLFGLLGSAVGFEIMPTYLLLFLGLMITVLELTFSITAKRT